jgi:hypothetical protein
MMRERQITMQRSLLSTAEHFYTGSLLGCAFGASSGDCQRQHLDWREPQGHLRRHFGKLRRADPYDQGGAENKIHRGSKLAWVIRLAAVIRERRGHAAGFGKQARTAFRAETAAESVPAIGFNFIILDVTADF